METVEHPTFETVWAMMQENAAQQRENARLIKEMREEHREAARETAREMKENAREMKENAQKTAREMKENAQEMDKRAALLDRQLSKLGGRFGEMVEHLVVPDLVEKFRKLGYDFDRYQQNTVIEQNKKYLAEIDIFLENGEMAMLVEVKSKLTTEAITEHLERMDKVRAYFDGRGDKRKFLGAVAGIVMTNNEITFALKNGFYVLKPSGDTFAVIPPEGIYSPREW